MIRVGDTHPSLTGWILSFGLETAISSTLPSVNLDATDRFLGSASVEFGDQNAGILCTLGGRLYCPFPTVTMSFYDALASGAATKPRIQIVARPVMNNQAGGASTQARGISPADIAAEANADFTVPKGAIAFWVPRPTDSATITILAQDGQGNAVEEYVLGTARTDYPLQSPAPWRDVPPWNNGDSNPVINIAVAAGATTSSYQVHWLFDLATLR